MASIELRDGTRLFYDDDDFTDPWTASPVVLLHHGVASSARFWYPWVPRLAANFRVIRLDARGWGRSSVVDVSTISLDQYVTDIAELLDQLGISSVHFCGQSLGGTIGVAFAAQNPESVRSLTLVASPTRIPDEAQRNFAFGYHDDAEAMENLGALGWCQAGAKYTLPADVNPALGDWFIHEMGQSNLDVMIAVARQIPGLDVEPLLAGIRCPVLLLYPEGGHIASADQRAIFTRELSDMRIVLLPGRHHAIASLYPDECVDELIRFIGIPARVQNVAAPTAEEPQESLT